MSCLIDGLEGGRFAFYVKVHHTVMDGVAGLQMITDALTTDSQRRSMPAFYAAHRHEASPSAIPPVRLLAKPLDLVRSLTGTAASGGRLLETAVGGEISNVLGRLTTDTAIPPLAAPYTRFNGRLGRERRVAAASWPKERIRAIQRSAE
jgi:diacylglycerol O-acyltransferase